MTEQYEYVAVKLIGSLDKNTEKLWTDRINSVAQHGWRFVGIGEHGMAIFERPKS